MRKQYLILSFWIFVCCGELFAYSYLPIVKCYDKNDYGAGRQNWDVGTDSNGIVYFGNNDGLLRYIYGNWILSKTAANDVVRSLYVENDTIWCGGDNEFGYFVKSTPYDLSYIQLGNTQGGMIWKIQSFNDRVYYQSSMEIIEYNKKNKETVHIKGGSDYSGMQVWNDKLWALAKDGSIGTIDKGSFNVVHQFAEFNKVEVCDLFVHDNLLHIVLYDGQVFTYNGSQLTQKKLPEKIKGKALFAGLSYRDKEYLLGTIANGLVQVNEASNQITNYMNSTNGLIDNTVLSIGADVNGNIWLGLDYGIAFIEMQNAIQPIFNQGASYGIENIGDTTFLATNKGLYRASGSSPFSLVDDTEGQAWRLRVINNDLYVCHNKGVLRIKEGKTENVYPNGGVKDIVAFHQADLYLLSAYSGLLLARKVNKRFHVLENLNIWGDPSLVYDPKNKCIWVSSKWEPIQKLTLSSDLKVVRKGYADIKQCFQGDEDIVFYNGNQLYDYVKGEFVAFSEAPFNLIKGENIVAMDFDAFNNVAYVQNGIPNMLTRLPDGNYYSYEKILSSLKNKLVKDYEFINIYKGELRIATDRGGLAFDFESKLNHYLVSNTAISKVQVLDGSEMLEFIYPYMTDLIQLPVGKKNILFHFGMNKASSDLAEFRYQLWPYDNEWSEWNPSLSLKEYTQLKGGSYKFLLQSRLNGGAIKEQVVAFDIAKYWYQTHWIILPYILLLGVCVYGIIYIVLLINKRNLNKKQEQYKQRMVEESIASKNKQLLQYIEVVSRKNEFLIELKNGLARMRNNESKQWENKIMNEVNSEKKRFFFDKLYSEVHQDFINRLTDKHPNLSPNDIRILSFIRINLGTKEIANLMNISSKSVDVSRYRLRKKMDLQHSDDLNLYIRDL
jgi:DNA-binding CsgD family transcriptional regulator